MAFLAHVLSYLAALLTTALGVYGIVHDFRDKKTGAVTRAGRTAIAGLLGIGLISLIAAFLGDMNASRSSDRVTQERDRLQRQVEALNAKLTDSATRLADVQEELLELRGPVAEQAERALRLAGKIAPLVLELTVSLPQEVVTELRDSPMGGMFRRHWGSGRTPYTSPELFDYRMENGPHSILYGPSVRVFVPKTRLRDTTFDCLMTHALYDGSQVLGSPLDTDWDGCHMGWTAMESSGSTLVWAGAEDVWREYDRAPQSYDWIDFTIRHRRRMDGPPTLNDRTTRKLETQVQVHMTLPLTGASDLKDLAGKRMLIVVGSDVTARAKSVGVIRMDNGWRGRWVNYAGPIEKALTIERVAIKDLSHDLYGPRTERQRYDHLTISQVEGRKNRVMVLDFGEAFDGHAMTWN